MPRRMLLLLSLLLVSALTCLACSRTSEPYNHADSRPAIHAGAAIPDGLKSYQQKAEAAFASLQQKIGGRLKQVIESEGAPAAVNVCKIEAIDLTSAIAEQEGFVVGRTSHRLRNPSNVVPAWAVKWVEEFAGKKLLGAEVAAVDLGDRVGVLAPIGVMPMCLTCHGDPSTMDASVNERIATQYPEDQATGFSAGDLRGWFWAEVPK